MSDVMPKFEDGPVACTNSGVEDGHVLTCGCRLFHEGKPYHGKPTLVCNACGAEYEVEYREKARG